MAVEIKSLKSSCSRPLQSPIQELAQTIKYGSADFKTAIPIAIYLTMASRRMEMALRCLCAHWRPGFPNRGIRFKPWVKNVVLWRRRYCRDKVRAREVYGHLILTKTFSSSPEFCCRSNGD
jgi:hypothetical protein